MELAAPTFVRYECQLQDPLEYHKVGNKLTAANSERGGTYLILFVKDQGLSNSG